MPRGWAGVGADDHGAPSGASGPAALLAEVRAYAAGPLRAWGERVEADGAVPPALWRELGSRGYLGLGAPAALGGRGLSLSEFLPLLEEFSTGHGSIRMIVHVAGAIWRPIVRYGSPAQAERFVRPLVRGESLLAFAATEPDTGGGADIRAEARREGQEYVLSGRKHLITFGSVAGHVLVLCRLAGTAGADGTMVLVVPRGTPGFVAEPMPEPMGLRGTDFARLAFDGCRVPAANRIGAEGHGLRVAVEGFLHPGRIGAGMACVGLGRRALELALEHARRRVTFGRPIGERQMVQAMLAEAAADVEAARQLVLWAARRWESRPPAAAESAMAKLYGLEALQRVTDRALQVCGGLGYFRGAEIERIYRDARAQRFEEGTAEAQKATIAHSLLSR